MAKSYAVHHATISRLRMGFMGYPDKPSAIPSVRFAMLEPGVNRLALQRANGENGLVDAA